MKDGYLLMLPVSSSDHLHVRLGRPRQRALLRLAALSGHAVSDGVLRHQLAQLWRCDADRARNTTKIMDCAARV